MDGYYISRVENGYIIERDGDDETAPITVVFYTWTEAAQYLGGCFGDRLTVLQ